MPFSFQEERWWWFWPEGKGREKSGFECILEIDLAHCGLVEYGEGQIDLNLQLCKCSLNKST